ncbi:MULTISPECIES: hypothetical protein [Sphingobacterium]|nr:MULTISPECIES: hypothetical protein [Sphingobacterium]
MDAGLPHSRVSVRYSNNQKGLAQCGVSTSSGRICDTGYILGVAD